VFLGEFGTTATVKTAVQLSEEGRRREEKHTQGKGKQGAKGMRKEEVTHTHLSALDGGLGARGHVGIGQPEARLFREYVVIPCREGEDEGKVGIGRVLSLGLAFFLRCGCHCC
jgi:hypothetical protein